MSFITPAARQSLERVFREALRANIGRTSADEVMVEPLLEPSGKSNQSRTLVLITCTSLRFKLVAVFQVLDAAQVESYFGSDDQPCSFLEALSERGNMCCGAMNRDLLVYTPHLGLSTPSILNSTPAKVLGTLPAEHVSHFAIHINGSHLLDASLCMRGQAPVDFVLKACVTAVETGELELL